MKAFCKMILLAAILVSLYQSELIAQPYMHSAGIRAGYSSGLSYKGFLLHRMSAFEVDFMYNKYGYSLTALYEYHLEPFQKNSRTFIYLGGGPVGGDWDKEFFIGLAAVCGIEYTLRDVPLNFSLDWKPMLNILEVTETDWYIWYDFGISIRYRFGR